jgi:hypothetical protein
MRHGTFSAATLNPAERGPRPRWLPCRRPSNDKYSLGELPVEAPYIVETSPGNFQPVYIFERPLVAAVAKPVLAALSDSVGGDSGTKDCSHVWRIPGRTPPHSQGTPPNRATVHELAANCRGMGPLGQYVQVGQFVQLPRFAAWRCRGMPLRCPSRRFRGCAGKSLKPMDWGRGNFEIGDRPLSFVRAARALRGLP